MLVLEAPVEALDHALGLGGVMAGPHVAQLWMAGEEAHEPRALERRPIVGDDRELDRIARGRVDASSTSG